MAEGAGAVPIKADFGRDSGKGFRIAFWTTHNYTSESFGGLEQRKLRVFHKLIPIESGVNQIVDSTALKRISAVLSHFGRSLREFVDA